MNNLISIIIPTYNRANLIGETLQSIGLQTYQNWECLIIDDGSTDGTENVLRQFTEADPRFKYFKRPDHKPKGANACRNYGFEISSGDYVIWFDSDDIMLADKLSKHVALIEQKSLDFSIGRYEDFSENRDDYLFTAPKAYSGQVDLNMYIVGKTYWGTIDFLGRREFIGEKRFNESLKSGQEYNFFIALLAGNKMKGEFIDEVLCKRRVHANSIQQVQRQNILLRLENKFWVYWETYRSNNPKLDRESNMFLLQKAVIYYHKLTLRGNNPVPLSIFVKTITMTIGFIKAKAVGSLMLFSRWSSRGDLFGSYIIKKLIS